MTTKQKERQAKKYYNIWEHSKDYALVYVYKTSSANKARAWRHCQQKQLELKGRELKVITHNSRIFTAGFEYYDEKSQTVKFYYITPSYECAIDITADML